MPTFQLCSDRLTRAAAAKGDRSVYAIAKRTGLNQSALGRLRRGLTRPSARTLLTLAETYGLSVEDLVEPSKTESAA
ncbi:helix-turn-helix domain-containing protein [Streptomyces sp. DW26H14]|uniref:helix-turn-helix domain-containing protein n=1 Tax=Streptomyces sp. DW26H14 TaxID=3435395 RepID=UPI00403E2B71